MNSSSLSTLYRGSGGLDISILPKNIKKIALLKLEEYEDSFKNCDLKKKNSLFLTFFNQIKNILKSEETSDIRSSLRHFYKHTKVLDQYRGNSFEKTFPELKRLLDEDGRWKP